MINVFCQQKLSKRLLAVATTYKILFQGCDWRIFYILFLPLITNYIFCHVLRQQVYKNIITGANWIEYSHPWQHCELYLIIFLKLSLICFLINSRKFPKQPIFEMPHSFFSAMLIHCSFRAIHCSLQGPFHSFYTFNRRTIKQLYKRGNISVVINVLSVKNTNMEP